MGSFTYVVKKMAPNSILNYTVNFHYQGSKQEVDYLYKIEDYGGISSEIVLGQIVLSKEELYQYAELFTKKKYEGAWVTDIGLYIERDGAVDHWSCQFDNVKAFSVVFLKDSVLQVDYYQMDAHQQPLYKFTLSNLKSAYCRPHLPLAVWEAKLENPAIIELNLSVSEELTSDDILINMDASDELNEYLQKKAPR